MNPNIQEVQRVNKCIKYMKLSERISSRALLALNAVPALAYEPWSILRGKSHPIRE